MQSQTSPRNIAALTGGDHTQCLHALRHPGTDSCTVGSLQFMAASIPRTMRLYLPLNLTMALLFHHRHLLKKPDAFVQRLAVNSLRSSLFLTLYCAVVWGLPCHFSNALGEDQAWMYVDAVLFANCSSLLLVGPLGGDQITKKGTRSSVDSVAWP